MFKHHILKHHVPEVLSRVGSRLDALRSDFLSGTTCPTAVVRPESSRRPRSQGQGCAESSRHRLAPNIKGACGLEMEPGTGTSGALTLARRVEQSCKCPYLCTSVCFRDGSSPNRAKPTASDETDPMRKSVALKWVS